MRDLRFVLLSVTHGAVLLALPSVAVVALGLWWDANTIAHNFIHRPFFRSSAMNRLYSIYLSVLLGIPQSLWRDRHLRHHAEAGHRSAVAAGSSARRTPLSLAVLTDSFAVLLLWFFLAWQAPHFFAFVYLPGYALGLGLCVLQGHYEHARGTTSHYGRLYNLLFFNDGYHVEHHRRPHAPWTDLPNHVRDGTARSRWPAVLRWLDVRGLEGLERLVVRSPALQRFVLSRHERAFRAALSRMPPPEHVTIVGGGLFPRSALIVRKLLPSTRITIVDVNEDNLASARSFLDGGIDFVHGTFPSPRVPDSDLLVLPLAFFGDRAGVYRRPPARAVFVHDWIWSRGTRPASSFVISWWLIKRLNVVSPEAA